MKKRNGLVMVFTGNGKGKTTAALGQALRAFGQEFKVCMIQFIKAVKKTGEHKAITQGEGLFEMLVLGTGFIKDVDSIDKAKTAAQQAWEIAYEKIVSGQYDMIILDELTYVVKYNLIPVETIVEALTNKPRDLHIVVTGRDAPQEIIDIADMVTEMREVKHHLDKGIKSQRGIEF